MAKYAYPAIFTPDEKCGYTVTFPDLDGCYTEGATLAEALYMAKDVLALILYGYETDKKPLPSPSQVSDLRLTDDAFVNFVACDTTAYRKKFNNTAVKKTLTIPEWLNEMATASGINFSQVLQEALIQKLQIK